MMTVVVILLLVILAAVLYFFEELYRYVFCRRSSRLFMRLFDTKGHEPDYYQRRDEAAERLKAIPCEEWTMRSARGELLKGFYYPCGARGKRVVFLIHGYRSNHLETGGLFYEYYRSRGIDFFCCDHTASGQSEGKIIGFDVLESEDCLQWLNVLRSRLGEDTEIILHGFSMGGGTVLKMSSRCPANARFIISDSGFSSARASMDHMIGPAYAPLRWLNKLIGGYDWNDSDVTESLSKSQIPILFVHGRDDKLVPFQDGEQLYEGYQGPKACFFPEGTRHVESMYTQPEAYAAHMDAFLKVYLSGE